MTHHARKRPFSTLHALGHDLLSDPGFGFAICGIIYASKATTAAQICAFACAIIIVALRFVRRHANEFALSPRMHARLHDDGLSLRVLGVIGLASSLGTFTAIANGQYIDATLPYLVLQGSAAILFAVANFMLAASISGRIARSHRRMIAVLLQPETWLLGGMTCLGLMTGLDALMILPLLVVGYVLTLRNLKNNLPEHHTHPKLWYAAATLGFAALSPDGWLLAANIINAACLVAIEHRITPYGLFAPVFKRRQVA